MRNVILALIIGFLVGLIVYLKVYFLAAGVVAYMLVVAAGSIVEAIEDLKSGVDQ